MNDLFDLDFDLTMDDIEGCTLVEDSSASEDEKQVPDLFDGKFDISFYGLIPNTILREDTNVLTMLIQLSLDVPEARNKVVSLLRDMDVFIDHMERKIKADNIPPTVNFVQMNEIYETFHKKMVALKEAAKEITFNQVHNQSEQISEFFSGDMNVLTNSNKVSGVVTYIISTNKFDKLPKDSIAISLADRYRSLIANTTKTSEILDTFARLEEIIKNTGIGEKHSSTVSTLIKLTQYSSKSYYFTDEEVAAMEYLGFPYQVVGYERYFKSSPIKVLQERASKLNKSKSKTQEFIKNIEENKKDALKRHCLAFARKSYLCTENSKAGVNASCIYF